MRILSFTLLIVVLTASLVLADSSGNFSATGTSASCAIGAGGTFGVPGGPGGGTTLASFTADISTSSGNGVTLDIRPNLVTGLFTDTKISTSIPTSTADVGIQVCVTVDGSGNGVLPTSCVIYDERFQEISSQLFSQLTECTTTTACNLTTGVTCPTNFTCSAAAGPGVCLNNLCNFELILSTLSAHSFDFVINKLGTGSHTITASWSVVGQGAGNGGNVASCVGPGDLLVTQFKVFQNSGALSFSSL